MCVALRCCLYFLEIPPLCVCICTSAFAGFRCLAAPTHGKIYGWHEHASEYERTSLALWIIRL